MNFIFLMDPLETVNVKKDTSFILMLGAHRKGHQIYYLPKGGITLKDGRLIFHTSQVIPQMDEKQAFIIKNEAKLCDDSIDAVFIRPDPPFDYEYLIHTWLLDRLPKHIPVINRPEGIRAANEKIWVTQFTDIVPPNLVTRNSLDIFAFLEKHGTIIAKPTDGYGGQSVFRINQDDPNANVIIETVSQNFSRDIILQEFIKESEEGDKRILLLDGEPLGAVLRLHADGDHRNNFFSGGKPSAAEINARDKEIIKTVKPELKKAGLYFVGIDILGKYLIEINVTSPTCLQEINHFSGQQLEARVIEFVENLVEKERNPSCRI